MEQAREFTMRRLIDAPRERVFRAWTDPEQLGWFFNPGTALPDERPEVDLRVGGQWRQRMVMGDSTEYYTGGIYREIVEPERLAFTWGASDGWPPLDPDRPEDGILVTVLLNEAAEKTEMDFTVTLPPDITDDEVRDWLAKGIQAGWSDTIDRVVAVFASASASAPAPAPAESR